MGFTRVCSLALPYTPRDCHSRRMHSASSQWFNCNICTTVFYHSQLKPFVHKTKTAHVSTPSRATHLTVTPRLTRQPRAHPASPVSLEGMRTLVRRKEQVRGALGVRVRVCVCVCMCVCPARSLPHREAGLVGSCTRLTRRPARKTNCLF